MTTIKQWLDSAVNQLQDSQIPSARLDSLILLENTLGKSREWIIAHDDTSIDAEIEALNRKLTSRKNHTPIAYITGKKEFYGRCFKVNEHTLIPRPESEIIIHELIKLVENEPMLEPTTIADIGTGSGALAISAKLSLPDTTVIATDISKDSLDTAEENALNHGAQIQLYQADLLNLPKAVKPDIILANLPYVPDSLVTSEEIKAEPKIALFSGNHGLDHYTRFWNQLAINIHKPRFVITESLQPQHKALVSLANKSGYRLMSTDQLIQTFNIGRYN